tara:strand:- start:206 stop:523 length:318 start_codon:yes stop_codon:yes gene_type:complete
MTNKMTSSNPMHADGKPDMSKPVTATVDEIVARTADAIGAGKAFGGWTDKVEEDAQSANESVEQLDELPFAAPLLGMGARMIAGKVLGKVFKKSKSPGEEATASA